MAVLVMAAGAVYAADDTAALKQQVQQLNDRIAQLEQQLAQKQSVQASNAPMYLPTAGYSDMWDPEAEMNRMQSIMYRMRAATPGSDILSPRVDIKESPQQYIITMDIPGMPKDKIDVKVQQGNLVVSGERSSEQEDNSQGGQFYRHERSFGRFLRAVPLPSDIKTDNIDAQYNNGVLTVKVGRTGQGEPLSAKVVIK